MIMAWIGPAIFTTVFQTPPEVNNSSVIAGVVLAAFFVAAAAVVGVLFVRFRPQIANYFQRGEYEVDEPEVHSVASSSIEAVDELLVRETAL
jgi:hypothetical protein